MTFSNRVRRALSPIITEVVYPPDDYVIDYTYTPRPRVYSYLDSLFTGQPKPNYALDDDMINQIVYRIMTNIQVYRPNREVEISPKTRMKINL